MQLVPRCLMHWSAVTFVRVLVLALRFLPVRAIPTCGHLVGRLAQALMPQRRSILRRNMVVTGFKPDHLEQQAYSHIGSSLLIALLPLRRSIQLLARTAIAGGPVAAAAEAFSTDCRLGGVIVCSAHVGVWELVPAALSPYVPRRARRHGAIIYQPLHDAPLDRWLLRWRTRAAGMTLLPAHGSGSALRRALRTGGLVGLVADQRPATGGARVPVILLGQASELSPGLAALHRSTGAPVWFAVVLVERSQTVCGQSDSSLELRLHLERLAPRNPNAHPSEHGRVRPLAAECDVLMQAYADAVSRTVHSAPSQYYWLHRRFTGRSDCDGCTAVEERKVESGTREWHGRL